MYKLLLYIPLSFIILIFFFFIFLDEVQDFIIENQFQPSGNDHLLTLESLVSDYESRRSNITYSNNDLLVNYFVRGLVNGSEQPVGIDSTIDTSSTPLLYTNDIDSVMYISYTDIPFKNIQWQVYIRPDYTFSVRKDLGIKYIYDSNRQYGTGPISTCPNFSFLKHDFTNVSILMPIYTHHHLTCYFKFRYVFTFLSFASSIAQKA